MKGWKTLGNSDIAQQIKECGIDPCDGLLVAYLPPLDSVLQEYFKGTCKVYAQDGIVLDMLDDEKPRVKWWRVREAARQLQMAIVEPAWQGAAGDFTDQRLQELRTRWEPYLKDEGAYGKLFMRAYSNGPWICLDEEMNAAAIEAVARGDLSALDERFDEKETNDSDSI